MTTNLKISEFTAWTGTGPQGAFSQLEFATNDPTNTTLAPSGTDEYVTGAAILSTIETTFFGQGNTEVLFSDGTAPTSSANLTFASNILNSPTFLAKTDLRIEDPGVGTNYVAFQSPFLTGNTTYTLPAADGSNGQVLSTNGSAVLSWATNASGDVSGPGSATDNALARFDTTTGKLIQNSLGILSDAGALSGLTLLDVDNLELNGNTLSTTDTNGNLILSPNGTGIVSSTATLHSDVALELKQTTAGANAVTLQAPSSLSGSFTITLPSAQAGANGYVLSSTTAGITSWVSNAAFISSTVTTTWVGAWASGQSGDILAYTDGSTVFLRIPAVSATANTAAVVTNTGSALSVGLRPAAIQRLPIFAITDNATTGMLGMLQIDTAGIITISLAQAGIPKIQSAGTFAGAGASGWSAFTVSYVLL